MMKVLIKWIDENKLEELTLALSELGINPAPIYRSLQEGKKEATIECNPEDLHRLKSTIGNHFQLVPLTESYKKPISIKLLGLFLDTLLVYYILKLSIWSEDFNTLLNRLFYSSKAVLWIKALLSLLFIVLYQHAFFSSRGAPPVSGFLGISYDKDKNSVLLAYTLPLIALYFVSIGATLFKLLGLFMLSLSVALIVYAERTYK